MNYDFHMDFQYGFIGTRDSGDGPRSTVHAHAPRGTGHTAAAGTALGSAAWLYLVL